MFVNCKHCHALVATDPVTDLPPERCPRCAGVLRLPQATPTQAASSAEATAAGSPAAMQASSPRATESPCPPSPTGEDEAAAAIETAPKAALRDALAAAADAAAAPTASDPATSLPPVGPAPVLDAAAPLPARIPDESTAPAGNAHANASTEARIDDAPRAPAAVAAEGPHAPARLDDADSATVAASPPADPSVAVSAPGFLSRVAPDAPTPAPALRWLPAAAIASLGLLLGLQVLLADRDRLAADARWRPLVASVCGLLGCSIPAWHEPAAFALLARDVRPHPDKRNALRVSATFRNDARWTQDWPRLVLTLSDVDGRPVAARAFDAGDYLGPAAAGLDPGQTADIALDIREPAAATVSYAFDFR